MRPSFSRTILRWLIILACLAAIFLVRSILLPFVLAFFLAYLIDPLVGAIERRGASRSVAVLTVFTIAAILTAVMVAVVVPLLVAQLQQAVGGIPRYLEKLNELGLRAARVYNRLHLPVDIRVMIDRLIEQFTARIEGALAGTLAVLINLLPGSVVLLIVPIIAYYISRDFHQGRRSLRRWLDGRARPDLLAKARAVDRVLTGYFRGQALEILVMTIIITIGLGIVGLDFAILLGILAGLLNIIPYFGPLLGALPPFLLALTRSPWQAGYVALLFFVANQAESFVLIPRLIGHRVGLHPVAVIFALLAGGKLFGLLGLVIAVPVAAVIKVVIFGYLSDIIVPSPGLTSLEASDMMDEEPSTVRKDQP